MKGWQLQMWSQEAKRMKRKERKDMTKEDLLGVPLRDETKSKIILNHFESLWYRKKEMF